MRNVLLIGLLLVGSVLQAQVITDGNMETRIRFENYHQEDDGDTWPDASEFNNEVKVRDYGDLDNAGWFNAGVTSWSNQFFAASGNYTNNFPDYTKVFTYGANNTLGPQQAPEGFQIGLEGWEDDCHDCCAGSVALGTCTSASCSGCASYRQTFENDCSGMGCNTAFTPLCLDIGCGNDDNHCAGEHQAGGFRPFRDKPPSMWSYQGWIYTDDGAFTSNCGGNDNGVDYSTYWTPPCPNILTADFNVLCEPGWVTLETGGAVFGGEYAWYDGATFLQTTPSANPTLSVFVSGSTPFRVYTRNGGMNSWSYQEITIAIGVPEVTDVTTVSPNCVGGNDGVINVIANSPTNQPPLEYSIDSGNTYQLNSTFDVDITAGEYYVFVRDAGGCIAEYPLNPVIVSEPLGARIDSVVTESSTCVGANDGSITIYQTNGFGQIEYSIDNGLNYQASNQFTNLPVGTYNARVRYGFAGECEVPFLNNPVSIVDPPPIQVSSISVDEIECYGGQDGRISIFAFGGTGALQYSIDSGVTYQPVNVFNNISAGSYHLFLRDENNCIAEFLANPIILLEPPEMLVTADTVNPSCASVDNGSIELLTTGGSPPYLYSLNNGPFQPGNSFSNLSAGTYDALVQDFNGCSANLTINLADQYVLTLAVNNATDVSCFGGTDGTVSLSTQGGARPFIFSNGIIGSADSNFNALSAANYTFTVTDQNGCAEDVAQLISEPQAPLSVIGSPIDVSCNGDSSGSISLTVTGGTPTYNYIWSDGFTLQNRTNLSAGAYAVTVRDVNNCEEQFTATIGQSSAMQVSYFPLTQVSCFGGDDGSINANVSGGNPPYNYSWSNGAFIQGIGNLTASTYILTVTDAQNCTLVDSVLIDQPAELTVNMQTTDLICNGDQSGAIDITVSGGVAPYDYFWSTFQFSEDLSNLAGGRYVVILSDDNDCELIADTVLNEPDLVTASLTASDVVCNGANDGKLIVNATGGTAPYTYSIDGSTYQTADSFVALAPGNYTIDIQDANSCTGSAQIAVNEPPALFAVVTDLQDESCASANDGSIDVTVGGGIAPYSFEWSNAAQTEDLIAIGGGQYSVTITDANGCTTTQTASVGLALPIIIDLQQLLDVSCNSADDGQISINVSGGTPPYVYSWSNGSNFEDLVGLSPAEYRLTVSDQSGCEAQDTFTVIEPAVLTSNFSILEISCNGGADGAIDLTVSGGTLPYDFLWSTFQIDEDIDQLSAGNYVVIITDANDCQIVADTVLVEAAAIAAQFDLTPPSCAGLADGEIFANISGGQPAYSYIWSDGSVSAQIANTAAGFFDLTVTDQTGCTASFSTELEEPDPIHYNIGVSDADCFGEASGTAIVSSVGGVPPYSYEWNTNPVQTDPLADDLPAGTYTLTISDASGCLIVDSVQIGQPAELFIDTLEPIAASCFGGIDGELTIVASGGRPPYTYSTDGITFDTSNVFTNLAGGTGGAVVQDANGCKVSEAFVIREPDQLNVELESEVTIDLGEEYELNPIITSVFGISSVEWSPAEGLSCIDCTNPLASPLDDIVYTIIVRDGSRDSCAASASIRIIVNTEFDFFVPTAFSPNGDGVNDQFGFGGAGVEQLDFNIYNRWGKRIWHTSNVDAKWDGRFKGEKLPMETYSWVANVVFRDGRDKVFSGSVTLLR